MKILKLTLLTILLTLNFSCTEKHDDVYKTKDQSYASKEGKWIAKFPEEPTYQKIENVINGEEIPVHNYRSIYGRKDLFNIAYVDYPNDLYNALEEDDIYNHAIRWIIKNSERKYDLSSFNDIKEFGAKGKSFKIIPEGNSINQAYYDGKIMIKGNRVYSVIYTGQGGKYADEFMSSFQLF